MESLQNVQHEQALNGFFGRLFKKIIIGACGIIDNYTGGYGGSGILSLIDFSGSYWNKTIIGNNSFDYDLTPIESLLINKYSESELSPFIGKLIILFESAVNFPIIEKLAVYNSIYNKIEILKQYARVNDIDRLSQEAVDLKIELITQLTLKLLSDIDAEIKLSYPEAVKYDTTSVIENVVDYLPLKIKSNSIQYKTINWSIDGVPDVKPTTTTIIASNGTVEVVNVSDLPSDNKGMKTLLGIAGIVVLGYVLFGGKKKK